MHDVFTLGSIAAILLVIGYILYLRKKGIDPNPVTWFMFTYSTGLLAVLELDTMLSEEGEADTWATMGVLVLPITCAILSWLVMLRCYKLARAKQWAETGKVSLLPPGLWPEDKWEKISFYADVFITIGYGAAFFLAKADFISEWWKYVWVVVFLILSNATTFTEFYPIVRSTEKNPLREHWTPWAWWTVSYAVLCVATYMEYGLWHVTMIYPASNVLTHGLVGWLARPSRVAVKTTVFRHRPAVLSAVPGE